MEGHSERVGGTHGHPSGVQRDVETEEWASYPYP